MRILFVRNLFQPDELGGNRYPVEVCARLAARGHAVTVVSSRTTATVEAALPSVRRIGYPVVRWHPVTTHVSNIWSARRCVARLLRQESFDVVLVSSYDAAVGTLALRGLRDLPTIFIYHSSLYHPWLHATGTNGHPWWLDLPGIRPAAQAYVEGVERFAFGRVRRIVAVSRFSEREIAAVAPSAQPRTLVIPTGVDTRIFAPAADRSAAKTALGLASERPLVIGVGRLTAVKRFDRWLRAMAAVHTAPSWQGAIIGGGPADTGLRQLAEELGLSSRIIFTGYAPSTTVAAWMRAADLELCSSQFENQSLAILEALSCGTPVAGPPVGGVPEAITRVDPALVAGQDSVEALTACVRAYLRRTPEEQHAVRERCRELAVSTHDWERVVDQLEQVLQGVVG
ncbi:MAG: glycosyltransferase family 4 protein [Candidatus Omnitrophica bacterium]|nr:glycosyltransferase family 4 protein [Candidatus Omnitrophota bacterium]